MSVIFLGNFTAIIQSFARIGQHCCEAYPYERLDFNMEKMLSENIEEVLPLVPCREGQSVYNGMVYNGDGSIVGRFNPIREEGEENDKLEPVPWSDFSKIQFPENRWIIKNLIPAGGFVILAAPSGEKKTWVALVMANSIATGEPFLGQFHAEAGAILYLNGEMPKSEVQRRGKLLGLTESGNIWLLNQELDFYNDEEKVVWLFEYIREKNIKAVFVDTFRAYAGGVKEEKAEEIRSLLNKFKQLKDLGVALILLDHTRKPNHFEGNIPKKEQIFASQDKAASVEVLIMLKSNARDNDIFAYQVKNRLGREIEPFLMTMADQLDEQGQAVSVSLTYKGEFVAQEHKQEQAEEIILTALADDGKTTGQLIEIVKQEKIAQRNARDAIRALMNKGRIEMPRKVGRQNFYILPKEEEEKGLGLAII